MKFLRTIDEARADATTLVWATHREWCSSRLGELTPTPRVIVATSSWQDGVLKGFCHSEMNRSFIVPLPVRPNDADFPAGQIEVVYRGDDTNEFDITASALVVSAFTGIETDARLTVYGKMPPVAIEAMTKNVVNIETFTEEEYRAALTRSHVFAYPAIDFQSQNEYVMEAMSSGCMVVVPGSSGFRETCAATGLLVPTNQDPNVYATTFGVILREAIDLAKNKRDEIRSMLDFQKTIVDYTFSKERTEYGLEEVESVLSLSA